MVVCGGNYLSQHIVVCGGNCIALFGNISHTHLRKILDLRIKDGVVRRMIDKWLRAGVLEDGILQRARAGTPQGGVMTPPTQKVTSSSSVFASSVGRVGLRHVSYILYAISPASVRPRKSSGSIAPARCCRIARTCRTPPDAWQTSSLSRPGRPMAFF